MVDRKGKAAMSVGSSSSVTPNLTDTVVTMRNTTKDSEDVERASSNILSHPDPFQFRDALKTPSQLAELRLRKMGKRLEKYHRRQNNLILSLLKPMEDHTQEAKVEEDAARLPVNFF